MLVRYVTCASLAGGTAFGLFLLMHSLISMQEGRIEDREGGRVIEFVRVKRASDTELKKRELPQAKPPQDDPPPPDIDLSGAPKPELSSLQIAVPEALPKGDLAGQGGLAASAGNADVVPLVRVAPQYPLQAAEQRIEGWVVLQLTISAAGTVADALVLDAEPKGVFERAALQAVRKWKYKPRVEDGVPVEREGVKVKLEFKLARG